MREPKDRKKAERGKCILVTVILKPLSLLIQSTGYRIWGFHIRFLSQSIPMLQTAKYKRNEVKVSSFISAKLISKWFDWFCFACFFYDSLSYLFHKVYTFLRDTNLFVGAGEPGGGGGEAGGLLVLKNSKSFLLSSKFEWFERKLRVTQKSIFSLSPQF